jgi:hypothetical protein
MAKTPSAPHVTGCGPTSNGSREQRISRVIGSVAMAQSIPIWAKSAIPPGSSAGPATVRNALRAKRPTATHASRSASASSGRAPTTARAHRSSRSALAVPNVLMRTGGPASAGRPKQESVRAWPTSTSLDRVNECSGRPLMPRRKDDCKGPARKGPAPCCFLFALRGQQALIVLPTGERQDCVTRAAYFTTGRQVAI